MVKVIVGIVLAFLLIVYSALFFMTSHYENFVKSTRKSRFNVASYLAICIVPFVTVVGYFYYYFGLIYSLIASGVVIIIALIVGLLMFKNTEELKHFLAIGADIIPVVIGGYFAFRYLNFWLAMFITASGLSLISMFIFFVYSKKRELSMIWFSGLASIVGFIAFFLSGAMMAKSVWIGIIGILFLGGVAGLIFSKIGILSQKRQYR